MWFSFFSVAQAGLDGVVLDQSYSEEAFMDLITPSGIAFLDTQSTMKMREHERQYRAPPV